MKNKLFSILVFTIMAAINFSCIGQSKIFKEISSNYDVTTVRISKTMMRLARNVSVLSGDKDVAAVSKSLKGVDGIELVTCDRATEIAQILPRLSKLVEEYNLEVLVEVKDGNQNVYIYGHITDDDPGKVKDILIVTSEPTNLNLIFIQGTADLETLMNQYVKEKD